MNPATPTRSIYGIAVNLDGLLYLPDPGQDEWDYNRGLLLALENAHQKGYPVQIFSDAGEELRQTAAKDLRHRQPSSMLLRSRLPHELIAPAASLKSTSFHLMFGWEAPTPNGPVAKRFFATHTPSDQTILEADYYQRLIERALCPQAAAPRRLQTVSLHP